MFWSPYFFYLNTIPLFSYDLVLVENFIFIILKSFILRDEKENCWKTIKERNSFVDNISAIKKIIIDFNEFYLDEKSFIYEYFLLLSYLKSKLGLRYIFFFNLILYF
jgi:hypothetical protein